MDNEDLMVRSQLIPITGLRLVLPNTAIAEVVSYRKPEPLEIDRDWLLGGLTWRGYRIPIVSMDQLINGQDSQANKHCRIIVCNGLSGEEQLPFYGFVAQGIPRLMSLDNNNTMDSPEQGEPTPYILRRVLIDGHQATIPNQVALEKELVSLGAITQAEELVE